jgi:hypothetical protein
MRMPYTMRKMPMTHTTMPGIKMTKRPAIIARIPAIVLFFISTSTYKNMGFKVADVRCPVNVGTALF